jgi:hypothetical protein
MTSIAFRCRAALGVASLIGLGACASAFLLPAPSAKTIAGAGNIAVDEVGGVRVSVQADAWQGDRSVLGHVQPMRVTIENRTRYTVRVRYGDFALVADGGKRYPALPPFRVEGDLLSPVLSAGFAPIMMPGFSYRHFYVAPYFARLYPGVPVYARSYLFYDPGYYAFWYSDFSRAVRPSVEVLSLALPEGVIEPDGRVSGFLYFRTVDPKHTAIAFRASIVAIHDGTAELGGTVVGEVSVPFSVSRKR